MLNRALRTKYADIIMKMGFFISDLHRHIEQLHSEQFHEHSSGNTLTVYRSQCLSKVDFDKMMNTIGGLLAFNNFLFASKDRNFSLHCAHDALVNPDMVGILFVMTIDPIQSTTPFASITAVDYHGAQEDKVLFSMDSIFRIQDIKSIGETNRLYQVEVTLISDNDKDLRVLTKLIQEEIPGSGWYRLGKLLRKMGHFDKAEEVYQILLAQATDESAKAPLYVQLGWIKDHEGDYQEAFIFYVKALEIQQKSVPPNHLDLSASYNNIGAVHNNLGDYSKALSNYQKALEIQQQSLTPNQPDLAVSYTNIGALYGQMGEYRTALSHFEKALEIQQQLSPSTDLSLAASYNNIGVVYYYMSDYSQALSNYEKALEIKQQSLPPNHPDLGIFYNNIGEVYCKMCEYSKALSYYEKALEIQQSLPPNHPDLAVSYNNIGAVYLNMGDDSKALCNSEKALQIRQQALHPNHPDLGDSYNNIGLVYENMDDYLKAHSFYERAVENGQRSLPTNHPTLQERKKNLKRVKNKL
jgi:tetratricopeptide (TPR) repeat protein